MPVESVSIPISPNNNLIDILEDFKISEDKNESNLTTTSKSSRAIDFESLLYIDSLRLFWESKIVFANVRIISFLIELKNYLLQNECEPTVNKEIFENSPLPKDLNSIKNYELSNTYDIFYRLVFALDFSKNGAFNIIQINKATCHLPKSTSLENLVLYLSYEARIILSPRRLDSISPPTFQDSKTNHSYKNLAAFLSNSSKVNIATATTTSDDSHELEDGSDSDLDTGVDGDGDGELSTSKLGTKDKYNILCKREIKWKVVSGPKNLGKSTLMQYTFFDHTNLIQNLDFFTKSSNPINYHDYVSKSKKVPRDCKDCIWLDMKGVSSKSSFISSLGFQLGILASNMNELERLVEIFFLNLNPNNLIIFDHVSFPFGTLLLKEFFEALIEYPNKVENIMERSPPELQNSDSLFKGKKIDQVCFTIVIITREFEKIENFFHTPTAKKDTFKVSTSSIIKSISISISTEFHYIPLISQKESQSLLQSISPVSLHPEDIDRITQTFGGVYGNIKELLDCGESGINSAKSIIDIDIGIGIDKRHNNSFCTVEECLVEIKVNSCMKGSSLEAKGCRLLASLLLPFNFIPFVYKYYFLSSESSYNYYDHDYLAPVFSRDLVWELCEPYFVDMFDKEQSNSSFFPFNIGSEKLSSSKLFSIAWQKLLQLNWIKKHQTLASNNQFHLAHPSFLLLCESDEPKIINLLSSKIYYKGTLELKNFMSKIFMRYLSLFASKLTDLNSKISPVNDLISPESNNNDLIASNHKYIHFKLHLLEYDSIKSHIEVLVIILQLKSIWSIVPTNDDGNENEGYKSNYYGITFDHNLKNVLNMSDDSSSLKEYYKLTTTDVNPLSFNDFCGVIPLKNKISFTPPDKENSIPITDFLFNLEIDDLLIILAGKLENLIKSRIPPIHSVFICKTIFERCVPIDPFECFNKNLLGKKILSSGNVKISSPVYVRAILELAYLLVMRKKYTKAQEILKLAIDIAQELEDSDLDLDENGDNKDSVLLVKALLSYAECIELSSIDVNKAEYLFFNEEETQLGYWIDTILIDTSSSNNEAGNGNDASTMNVSKPKKYYADGDSLRTVNYGHSKSSTLTQSEALLKIKETRAKAKPVYEQAIFGLEVLTQMNGSLKGEAAILYIELLNKLGNLENFFQNHSKAKQYFEDSIRWRKVYLGNYHSLVAQGFYQIGYFLQTVNKPESAIQVYSISLTILSSLQKESTSQLISSISAVSSALRALGQEKEASNYLREAIIHMKPIYHSYDTPVILSCVRYACTTASYTPKAFTLPGDGHVINTFGSRNFAISLRPADHIAEEYFCGTRMSHQVDKSVYKKSIEIIDHAILLLNFSIALFKRYDLNTSGTIFQGIRGDNMMDLVNNFRNPKEENSRLANIYIVQASQNSILALFDQSIQNLTEALSIFRNSSDDTDTRVADVLLAMGEMNKRAAMTTLCGDQLSHSHTLNRFDSKLYSNLFQEKNRQRRLKDSLEAFRDSLNIYKNIYGKNHSIVLAIMRSIANVYRDMGSFNSSKKMFEDILEIYRELKNGPTLEYADSLFYYAAMLCSNDEHGEAVTLLEQAVSIYRRINGEDNLATTVCVFLLGSAYFNSESDFLDESVKILDECLISFRKLLGLTALESDKSIVEPPVIGDVLNMLGSANHSKKEFEIAKIAYGEALEIFNILYGDTHPSVARTMNNLATLLVDSEDSNDAIQLFDASLTVLNDYYKSAHPLILVTVENYASYLYSKGNIEDSENLYAQANEIREALYYIDKNIPDIEEDMIVQISEWDKIAALLKSFCVII